MATNLGLSISKKRFCLFINKLNIVQGKVCSEAGFCKIVTSNVMALTGKNLLVGILLISMGYAFYLISSSAIFSPEDICRRKTS